MTNKTKHMKKKKMKKRHGIWVKLLALYHPPLTFYSNAYPLCLQDILLRLTPPLRPLMDIPPIPTGNQALAAAISRANTPRLLEPPSPSRSAQPSPPLASLAEIFTETRNSLQLNSNLVQDLSPHALQTITAGEGSIRSILCTTVSGIVAITTQLETVNTQLSEFRNENQELRTKIHDLPSMVANEVPTHDDIRPLHSALRDLSHRVTATAPTARPTAPTAPPQPLPCKRSSDLSHPTNGPHSPTQCPLSRPPMGPGTPPASGKHRPFYPLPVL